MDQAAAEIPVAKRRKPRDERLREVLEAVRAQAARARPVLALPVEAADQRLGDLGVELRPGAARELGDRLGVRARRAVGAVGRDRAVGVAGEDDPAADRDRRRRAACRGSRRRSSARARGARSSRSRTSPARRRGSARRSPGARASAPTRRRSGARACCRTASGIATLPMSCSSAAAAIDLDLALADPELACDAARELDDVLGVLAGVAVALEQRVGERLDDGGLRGVGELLDAAVEPRRAARARRARVRGRGRPARRRAGRRGSRPRRAAAMPAETATCPALGDLVLARARGSGGRSSRARPRGRCRPSGS